MVLYQVRRALCEAIPADGLEQRLTLCPCCSPGPSRCLQTCVLPSHCWPGGEVQQPPAADAPLCAADHSLTSRCMQTYVLPSLQLWSTLLAWWHFSSGTWRQYATRVSTSLPTSPHSMKCGRRASLSSKTSRGEVRRKLRGRCRRQPSQRRGPDQFVLRVNCYSFYVQFQLSSFRCLYVL